MLHKGVFPKREFEARDHGAPQLVDRRIICELVNYWQVTTLTEAGFSGDLSIDVGSY